MFIQTSQHRDPSPSHCVMPPRPGIPSVPHPPFLGALELELGLISYYQSQSNVKRIDYDWSIFLQLMILYSIVKPISSRIVCDINHPGLLEPLREIYAIGWHCNIKRTCQKVTISSNIDTFLINISVYRNYAFKFVLIYNIYTLCSPAHP